MKYISQLLVAIFIVTFLLNSNAYAGHGNKHRRSHHRVHATKTTLRNSLVFADYSAVPLNAAPYRNKKTDKISQDMTVDTNLSNISLTRGGSVQKGLASWYGPGFHKRRTANGERYDMYAVSAASKTLPLNSYARVTDLRTGKHITVRINDRGPYIHHRIIDLSYGAAQQLGIIHKGTAMVQVEGLKRA